jgi:hypothetical protein
MAKKKKNDNLKYTIIIGTLIVLAIILLIVYFSEDNKMNRAMRESGYTTTEPEDPFYKRITTGNTLDDFYNDVANNKDSAYEEYYLLKESYSFIEQELYYQNEATSSLNISSDLRNLSITYSYEISYHNSYLLLEGDNISNDCDVVINNNVSQETVYKACNQIQQELSVFTIRREEILKSTKVQELIQNAPAVVPSTYED